MVGHVRFHSRPDPDYLRPYASNAVEFGYAVFAAYRRRRYAEEALAGLMQWAQEGHGVGRFVLTISPDNLPSRNLAAKFGFRKIGEQSMPSMASRTFIFATPRQAPYCSRISPFFLSQACGASIGPSHSSAPAPRSADRG